MTRWSAGVLRQGALPALMLAVALSGSPAAAQTPPASAPPAADAPASSPAAASDPAPAPAAPAGSAPVLTETEWGRQARAAVGDCNAALDYRPSQNVAQYRDTCRRPIAEKLVTMMELLDAALAAAPEAERAAAANRLVVLAGRIAQSFPDMAAELVETAAGASGWDSDAARRSAAFANAAVVRLLTRTDGGTAIRTAKAPPGYIVTGIAVDRVLTARPQRLPFPLPPHVVSANTDTPLPFDAMLWIALAKEGTHPGAPAGGGPAPDAPGSDTPTPEAPEPAAPTIAPG